MIWIIRSNGLQQSENGCNMGGKYMSNFFEKVVEILKQDDRFFTAEGALMLARLARRDNC